MKCGPARGDDAAHADVVRRRPRRPPRRAGRARTPAQRVAGLGPVEPAASRRGRRRRRVSTSDVEHCPWRLLGRRAQPRPSRGESARASRYTAIATRTYVPFATPPPPSSTSRPDAASAPRGAGGVPRARACPTASDEVWRYAPLASSHLDRFEAPASASNVVESAVRDGPGRQRRARRARVRRRSSSTPAPPPRASSVESSTSPDSVLGGRARRALPSDAFAPLNARAQPRPRRSCASPPASSSSDRSSSCHVGRPASARPSRARSSSRGAARARRSWSTTRGSAAHLVVPLSEYQRRRGRGAAALHRTSASTPARGIVGRATAFLARDARCARPSSAWASHYDRSRNDAEMHRAGRDERAAHDATSGPATRSTTFAPCSSTSGARTPLDAPLQGRRRRLVALGLHRPHRDARRAPSAPTRARRTTTCAVAGGARRQRAEPGHPRERRACARTPRRVGPLDELAALVPRVARRRARRRRASHDPGLLRPRCSTELPRADWRDLVEATSRASWPASTGRREHGRRAARWSTSRSARRTRCASGDRVLVRRAHRRRRLLPGRLLQPRALQPLPTARSTSPTARSSARATARCSDLDDGAPMSLPATRPVARFDVAVARRPRAGGGLVTLDARRSPASRSRSPARSCSRASTSPWTSGRGPRDHGAQRLGQVHAGPRARRSPGIPRGRGHGDASTASTC